MSTLSSLDSEIFDALRRIAQAYEISRQQYAETAATSPTCECSLQRHLAPLPIWERLQILSVLQRLATMLPANGQAADAQPVKELPTNHPSARASRIAQGTTDLPTHLVAEKLVIDSYSGGSTAPSIEVADCSIHSFHSRVLV